MMFRRMSSLILRAKTLALTRSDEQKINPERSCNANCY
jgi:hypothetical protein